MITLLRLGRRIVCESFVEIAFAAAGLDWRCHVEVDRRYFRPTEVDALRGDLLRRAKFSVGNQGLRFRGWSR